MMKRRKFWIPIIVSILITPISLFVALLSTGAGHGNYLAAIILFPYTLLSAVAFGSITVPFILLAILQFPLYGVILGRAAESGTAREARIALLVIHGLAVAILFARS